jgi:hypothetical protein
MNNEQVEIIDGLTDGKLVVLAPESTLNEGTQMDSLNGG